MKILALDFDGVIAESSFEVFVVSWNTYLKLSQSKLIDRLFTFEQLDYFKNQTDFLNKFHYLRAYAKSADELIVCFYLIENNTKINSINEFKAQLDKYKDQLESFWKEFYVQRDILQKDLDKWISLENVFPKIIDATNKLSQFYKIVILTNKNMAGVIPTAKHYGLKIEEKDIFDTSLGNDKRKKLKIIKEKYNVEYEDISFVDDVLENLEITKPTGVKLFLATWYNKNKEHHKLAQEQGITLLTEENFYISLITLK
jgi:phosphoglycolate phosphatase-like HAD superfamily hydrolase